MFKCDILSYDVCVDFYVCLSRLTGGIMFLTSPFFRYQKCEHDILKTNCPILLQISTSGP